MPLRLSFFVCVCCAVLAGAILSMPYNNHASTSFSDYCNIFFLAADVVVVVAVLINVVYVCLVFIVLSTIFFL